jgi:hypothetical protein
MKIILTSMLRIRRFFKTFVKWIFEYPTKRIRTFGENDEAIKKLLIINEWFNRAWKRYIRRRNKSN